MITVLEMAAGVMLSLVIMYLYGIGWVIAGYIILWRRLKQGVTDQKFNATNAEFFDVLAKMKNPVWRTVIIAAMGWPFFAWEAWREDRAGGR